MNFPPNTLQLTDNSKTKFKRRHFNTFGLLYGLPENGGTCPHATTGEGGCLALKKQDGVVATCYVDKIARVYPKFHKVLQHNTSLLVGKSKDEIKAVLQNTLSYFVKINKGRNLYFRIATSGDFFNSDYAEAWRDVILEYSQVQFWVYTRSFWTVPILINCPNLALYISADQINFQQALEIFNQYKQHNNLGLAFMGNDEALPEDVRWVKCPAISGKVKSLPNRGACAKCRLCLKHSVSIKLRNIQFPIH